MKRIFIFPTVEEAKAFLLTQPRDPVFVGGVGMAEIAAATVRAVKARKPQLAVLAGIAGACERTLRRGEVVEVVTERAAGIPARYAREYETTGPDLGLPLAAGITVSRSGDSLRGEPGTAPEAAGGEPGTNPEAAERMPGDTGTGQERVTEQENTTGPQAAGTGQAQAQEGAENAEEHARRGTPGGTHDLPEGTETDRAQEGTPNGTDTLPEETLPEVENMEGAAFFAVCEALGVACCEVRAVSNYVGEPFGEWAVGEAVENLTEKLTQIFGNDE